MQNLLLSDKKFKKEFFNVLFHMLFYVMIFLATIILWLVLKPRLRDFKISNIWWRSEKKKGESLVVMQDVVYLLLLLSMTVLSIKFIFSKRISVTAKITVLLIIGYILKVGYPLGTICKNRQHDVWGDTSHEGYAWIIYTTGKLPTTNEWQFYHPPLNAFVQATFMRFFDALTQLVQKIIPSFSIDGYLAGQGSTEAYRYYLFSSCSILSVFYSFVASFIMVKTLIAMGLKGNGLVIGSAVVILFPNLIVFAGALNNDPLAFMFQTLAIYKCVKWWKCGKSWGDMLFCGLFIGLGMNTKLNSAIVALPIAFVFIYEFVRSCGKKENALSLKTIIFQFIAFVTVCAPIGLWFSVYAKIRFGQELGYIAGEEGLNPYLSTSGHSFVSRFLICFDKEQYTEIWARPFIDGTTGQMNHYNILNYAIRTALMGEYSYYNFEFFASNGIIFSFVFLALLLASFVFYIVYFAKKDLKGDGEKERVLDFIFVAILVLGLIGSFVLFNVKMPYACTQDFRYIMPFILVFAYALGTMNNRSAEMNKFGKGLTLSISVVAIIVLVSMSTMFLLYA